MTITKIGVAHLSFDGIGDASGALIVKPTGVAGVVMGIGNDRLSVGLGINTTGTDVDETVT